jgi:hypothetical protein
MGNILEYALRLNDSGFTGPVERSGRAMDGFQKRALDAEKALARNRAQMGQMAMQMQDVIVQLQGGTKWTTVFAQQGSQMLSAFGPVGMVAGGFAALGGAIFAAGQQAKAAFDVSREATRGFHSDLQALIATASDGELVKSLKAYQSEHAKAQKTLAGVFDWKQVLGDQISWLGGGPSIEEKYKQNGLVMQQAAQAQATILARITQSSEEDLRITVLRATGQNDVADAIKRQIDLKQTLAKIDAMPVPSSVKDQLKSNASAASFAMGRAAASAAAKERQAKQESLDFALKELEIIELQAAGKDRQAAKLKEELEGRRAILDLVRRIGMSQAEAEKIVGRRQAAEARIKASSATKDEGRGRIRSLRDGSTLAASSDRNTIFGAVSQFARLQQREGRMDNGKMYPNPNGLFINSAFGGKGYGPQGTGRLMGGGLDALRTMNPGDKMGTFKRPLATAPNLTPPAAAKATAERQKDVTARVQGQSSGGGGGGLLEEIKRLVSQIEAHTAKLEVVR